MPASNCATALLCSARAARRWSSHAASMRSGLSAMKMTAKSGCLRNNSTRPRASGARSASTGGRERGISRGGFGARNSGFSNRGTTRGERTTSTVEVAACAMPGRVRGMTATSVAPSTTTSPGASGVRAICSPPTMMPFAELRSMISTSASTLMRAWRFDTSASSRTTSADGSRPITFDPERSGRSVPASGPDRMRSIAAGASSATYSGAAAICTVVPERMPDSPTARSGSRARGPPDSCATSVTRPGSSTVPVGSATTSVRAMSPTVDVPSAVTSRSTGPPARWRVTLSFTRRPFRRRPRTRPPSRAAAGRRA